MKKFFVFVLILLSLTLTNNENLISGQLFNFDQSNENTGFSSPNIFSLEKIISARRGGGSFRGFRGSSRSRSSTRSSSRSTSRSAARAARPMNPQKSPSFGGSRMSSSAASAKYGVPRKVVPMAGKNAAGTPMNYNVHHYGGGFSNSLMTGYMLGNMSWWMWAPAMFYSRPVYVEKGDGSVDVHPPTFNWGRLFTVLAIIAVIAFFINNARKAKNRSIGTNSHTSFS
jgi:hypothetical protein